MEAIANPAAAGFHSALAETLERLGERFETEIHRAKREQSERLNQIFRRLRRADGETAWSQAAVDGAATFAPRCLLAAVEDGKLRLLAWRGLPQAEPLAPIPLGEAAAFATAVETGEPVVALRGARELSAALKGLLGNPEGGKAYLFPVHSGERTAAVLYADSEAAEPDASCLEIVAAAAGAALPGANAHWKKPESLVELGIAPPVASADRKRLFPAWEDLPPQDRELHLRAQRMARARVAGLRLYHHGAVLQGRAESDLYGCLKEQIDSGRDEFRTNFLEGCNSMVDYFHLELLSRIANDDADLLGSGYPGPMVQSASVPDGVV